jgi:hypothetical protein
MWNDIRSNLDGLKETEFNLIRVSLIGTLPIYESFIWNDDLDSVPSTAKHWLMLHDLIASYWGYYGDLDIHFKTYQTRLEKMLAKTNQAKFAKFIDKMCAELEQRDKRKRQVADYFKSLGAVVITV